MVPSNILQRVFCLRLGSDTATGFTIEVDGRQYLISAKHFLEGRHPSSTTIDILRKNTWANAPFQLISVEPDTVDIVVLALNQQLSVLLPIQATGTKGSFLSQETFFVGFPYGLTINGHSLNYGFPLPFVKHGIISSIGNNRGEPFSVDGINNPGFSGGPVVVVNDPANPTIIGVVSGYRVEQSSVYKQGQETDLSIRANTGLLVAFDLEYAIEAIKKNPIGYSVSASP